MITNTIKNIELFRVIDEAAGKTCYGFDQEWYTTNWQRRAGCGPTVAANIFYYLGRTRAGAVQDAPPLTRRESLDIMAEVWRFVTPTMRGIPSTKLLSKGAAAYIKANELNIRLDCIDIPRRRILRPKLSRVLSFLDEALRGDTPVAFLNLNNGSEKKLYSWHWVTLVALEYEQDGSVAFADVLDEGSILHIDLAGWFASTTLGGGFVTFGPA